VRITYLKKRLCKLNSIDKIPILFHTFHVDHVGPFETSRKRNKFLLVMDGFTKCTIIQRVLSNSQILIIDRSWRSARRKRMTSNSSDREPNKTVSSCSGWVKITLKNREITMLVRHWRCKAMESLKVDFAKLAQ